MNKKIVTGLIKRHPDGFGFLVVDKKPDQKDVEDVFVPASQMQSAMTNDKVTVRVEKERDGRFRGEIIRINERSQKRVAGKYYEVNSEFGAIKDEGKGWGLDLRIPKHLNKSAKPGQLVSAIVRKFPENGDQFLGEIIEIIGDPESALNDIRRVIINQNIPDVFSENTIKESQQFGANPTEADFKGRRDLRNMNLITIDGATAKDFDDAVYVETKDNGFHLIVAIADVSHYVKPKTAIDVDAYERGTSVYFPNFVVPMLPEALSNGLCSLMPHVPRLALVADMHFDFTGEMKNSEFYEAVIESKARVTYGEAQQVIDEQGSVPKLSHVEDTILRCRDLSKLLMIKRFKEGSLDLEVPETELVIDGTGEPIDVIRSERLFAHRLIEELMLAANVAVAKFLTNKDVPAMYRIHEAPDPLKIQILQKHLMQFGSNISFDGQNLQKKLSKALQDFKSKAEASVVHILTLRSMSQAKYTTENIGHFGLGFSDYTHFTSPIRRYPDLIVHRLIKSQIGVRGYNLLAEDDLQTAGTWLSACEQRSAKSERQIQSIKKARFMKKHVGEEFDGIVSSVTKFGIFVQLAAFNVDGLVRTEDLGFGRWMYDEENLRMTNKGTGFSYKLGDPLKVSVTSVDVESGQINFSVHGVTKTKSTNEPQDPDADSKRRFNNRVELSNKSKSEKSSKEKNRRFEKSASGSKSKGRFGRTSKESSRDQKPSSPKKQFERPTFVRKPLEKPVAAQKTSVSSTQTPAETKTGSNGYEIKPRYKSLSDYLDKNKGKTHEKDQAKKSAAKSAFGSPEDRKNTEKRRPSADHSDSVRKARPKKFSGKNKSR